MPKEWQDLDYPPDLYLIRIRPEYVQLVDDVLLAALGRTWERMRDIAPSHQQPDQPRSSTPEELRKELRSSRLGQELLILADYASGGLVSPEKVQRAMKRIYRMLFGDTLTNAYTLPAQFHETDVGKLVHTVYSHMYRYEELMTAAQAYRTLGVARQTLYNRLYKGRLTPIYWYGDLRFLKAEIEAWKEQRAQRATTSKQDE